MTRWIHRRTGPAGVREHAPETAEQRAERMAAIASANLATIDEAERRGILTSAEAQGLRVEEQAKACPVCSAGPKYGPMPAATPHAPWCTEGPGPRCESGWTGDRCTFPLFHEGPHSNDGHQYQEAWPMATHEREDLRYWLDTVYDGRMAIDATIRKYGETPALAAAQAALNVAISEYRQRIHGAKDACVECGQPWPCDATTNHVRDGVPHRLGVGPHSND